MDNSEKIVDFYVKNNSKKYQKSYDEKIRYVSIAEDTVLSCICALGLHSEFDRDFDINKTIKMLFAKNFSDEDLNNLKDKNEYIMLREEYNKGNTLESFAARLACNVSSSSLSSSMSAYPEVKKLRDNYLVLRNTIRQGHIYWNVLLDRKESILEHIYGTILLAIGLDSEFDYCVDCEKIIRMLLLHETEEIKIGDLTAWDISEEEKKELGKEAVSSVLSKLKKFGEFNKLIDEFNSKKTYEAQYAYLFDKMEYDLQVKMYEMLGAYNFDNIPDNVVTQSSRVREIINNGANSVFDVHYEYDKDKYNYFPAIKRMLEYAKNN